MPKNVVQSRAMAGKQKQPKSKCCVSKPRCKRCPLRMLADGTLPDGYTVKKRKLVKLDSRKKKSGKKKQKSLPKAA